MQNDNSYQTNYKGARPMKRIYLVWAFCNGWWISWAFSTYAVPFLNTFGTN